MLLIVINFIIIISINMHLQSICEYSVNSVDIQYEIANTRKN